MPVPILLLVSFVYMNKNIKKHVMQFLELRDLLLELEFLSKVWLWTQVILAFEKVADNFSVSRNSPLGPQKIRNDLKIK